MVRQSYNFDVAVFNGFDFLLKELILVVLHYFMVIWVMIKMKLIIRSTGSIKTVVTDPVEFLWSAYLSTTV